MWLMLREGANAGIGAAPEGKLSGEKLNIFKKSPAFHAGLISTEVPQILTGEAPSSSLH
jgi:hypothetical protein